MRKRVISEGWRIEPHVCVGCMGRILSRAIERAATLSDEAPAEGRLYRCADCGIERTGSAPSVICTCGFKVRGRANLGLRCEPNAQRSPEFPAEFIARQA